MDSNKPADKEAETAQDGATTTAQDNQQDETAANSQAVVSAASDKSNSESLPTKKKKKRKSKKKSTKDPVAPTNPATLPAVHDTSTSSTLAEEEKQKKKRSSESKKPKPKKASNDVSEMDTTENSTTENSTIEGTSKCTSGKNAVFGATIMSSSLQHASRAEQERQDAIATLHGDPELGGDIILVDCVPVPDEFVSEPEVEQESDPKPVPVNTPVCGRRRIIVLVLVLVLVAIVAIAVLLTRPDPPDEPIGASSRPTEGPSLPPTLAPAIIVARDKLTASDGAAGDQFGVSIAVDGDTTVIGAFLDDNNVGSAYVFTRSGTVWVQQAKLTASDRATGDLFGLRVAVAGDTVVVGARRDDDNGSESGSAYVFTRSGTVWAQQAKLTASDGAAGDNFGFSIGVDGDTIVIGASDDDDNGDRSGSAYVYTRSGTVWAQRTKLTSSDGAAGDEFGINVVVDGDTIVVGARGDDDNVGSAYVFTRSGTVWAQQAKLTASDGAIDDNFGFSIAVDGDTVVVGAFFDDDNVSGSGSAYVYTRSGTVWVQQAKFTANDGAGDDYFGYSVAVEGDTMVIGVLLDDDNGSGSGSAYVYTRGGAGWTQHTKLTAIDGAAGDRFGVSVAVNGDTIVIGAEGDDEGSGSAYVFDII